MAKNLFDADIKGVPQIKTFNSGNAPVMRALTLSSSANESGLNTARANSYGKQ
jgi:hypothetical protein